MSRLFWRLLGENEGQAASVPKAIVVLPLLAVAIVILVVASVLSLPFKEK